MDTVYFCCGLVFGTAISYIWYLIGRNTSYQDKNVVPPPSPINIPKIPTAKKEPEKPMGWVDDLSDPPLSNWRPGSEL